MERGLKKAHQNRGCLVETSVERGLKKAHKLEAKIARKPQCREGLLTEMQTVSSFQFTIRNLWSGPQETARLKTIVCLDLVVPLLWPFRLYCCTHAKFSYTHIHICCFVFLVLFI